MLKRLAHEPGTYRVVLSAAGRELTQNAIIMADPNGAGGNTGDKQV